MTRNVCYEKVAVVTFDPPTNGLNPWRVSCAAVGDTVETVKKHAATWFPNRTVASIVFEEAPPNPNVLPVCSGCGEQFDPSNSDARLFAQYCSSECEKGELKEHEAI